MSESAPASTGTLARTELQVERLYNVTPTGQLFYTPDGLGLVWFDNSADALEQTGGFGAPVIQIDRPPAD